MKNNLFLIVISLLIDVVGFSQDQVILNRKFKMISPDTLFHADFEGLKFFFLEDSTFITAYSKVNEKFDNSNYIGSYSITSNGILLYPSNREFLASHVEISKTRGKENSSSKISGQVRYTDLVSGFNYASALNHLDFELISHNESSTEFCFDLSSKDTLNLKIPRLSNQIFSIAIDEFTDNIFVDFQVIMYYEFPLAMVMDKSFVL